MESMKHRSSSEFILEELEPRQLLSAGLEGVIDTQLTSAVSVAYLDVDSSQQFRQTSQADASEEQAGEQLSNEIAVIDSTVDGYQAFIDDIYSQSASNRHIEVVVLDSQRDGIEQISSILQQYDNLDALHIIAHGSDGSIQIGSGTLDSDTLQENRLDISLWANSFSKSGDILIYGCNLAESESGKTLINDLSDLTLADVAASDDLTGHSSQGGDWILEYHAGQIDSDIALSAEFQAQYREALATYSVTSLADSGAGTLRQAILDANGGVGADMIEFNVAGTISLQSALPALTEQITIDATTAPGFTDTPLVFIDGASAGASDGLVVNSGASGSIIKGLGLYNFNTSNTNSIWLNGASNVTLQSSSIGLDATGNVVGNNGGIYLSAGASNNLIGGDTAGAGNVITGSGTDGIFVNSDAGSANTILANSIYGNSGLAIDLATDGFNANDAGDADSGANDLQNFPVLAAAGTDGSRIAITGSINSTANTTLRIEFFANAAGDASGYGEGQNYLGYTTVLTDSNGDASFVASFDQAVTSGQSISATATGINADTSYGSTSEFSANVSADQALIVDTLSDVVDGNLTSVSNLITGKGVDGLISLREAIIASNNTTGHQTIFLTAGNYTLSLVGLWDDLSLTGDLDIIGDITIQGAGAGQTTIDASLLDDRVFEVKSGASLTLKDLTVANANSINLFGGAVSNVGTLVASDVVFRGNTIIGNSGGALYNAGNMWLDRVSLCNNTSTGGGAIGMQSGVLNMTNVTVSENTSDFDGGGIRIEGGTININYSTVAFNSATSGYGGGLYLLAGTANISNSIFANNTSQWDAVDVYGAVTSNGHNIFGEYSGFTLDVTDQSGDPGLSLLVQDDSTGQYFHAITGSSIAYNAAGGSAPVTDQLGNQRELSADIGAYEHTANFAPIIISAASVDAAENQTAVTTVTAIDVDGDALSYSITGGIDSALFSINSGGILSFNNAPDFENPTDANSNGVYQVQVTVDDGRGGSAAQLILVSVTNVNDAPQIISNAITSATQDSAYSYTLSSSDDDGDALSISATTLPAWLMLTDNGDGTALLSGTPGNAEVGNHNVVIEVSDGVLTTSQSFTINVANVNDAPQITSSAAVNAAENQTAVTTITATDADADALSYSITGGTDSALFSITSGGVLSFNSAPDFETPTDANSDGVYQVQVTVDDGQGGSAVQLISVSVSNVNDAPQIISSAITSATQDSAYSYTLSSSDDDGDALSISASTLPAWLTLTDNGDGSALLSGTPGNAEVGNHNVVIEVSDGVLTSSQSFTINVANVNDAPQITSSVITSATQDTAYNYTLSSNDVDGDALSISATTLPAWLVLTDNGDGTALLSGTPGNAEVGNHNVVIEVSDGVLSSSQSFTINVANVNDAPQFTSSANVNAAENQTAVTTVTATDVDGDPLSYSITGGTDSALFSITSGGTLSFNSTPDFETPTDANSDGVYQVQVTADDGQGGTATQLISVSVTNVNEAPSAVALSNSAVDENIDTSSGYSIGTLSSSDVDTGDSFSYSIVGGADAAVFSIGGASSNELILSDGLLDYETQASYQVTVRSTDAGGLSHDQSFSITINNLNEAPTITSSAITSATQDSAYSYTLSSSDDDGDTLSISATTLPAWLVLTDNGDGTALLSGTPGNAEVGNHNVVIEVSDGVLSSSQSFTINVANVNDAPQITSSANVNAVENQTVVTTVIATDVDADPLSYSISGGADSALFSISSGGILSFNSAPDFENPTDANSDGVYQVQVTADDGQGGTVAQLISVSVINVNEAPSAVALSNSAVDENIDTSAGYSIGTLSSSDDDTGDSFSYSIVGGADAAVFSIGGASSNELILSDGLLDYETQASYQVTVRSTDAGGLSHDQSFSITINNLNEGPTITSSAITSATQDNAYSYTLNSSDVDGDTLSISASTLPAWLTLTDNGDGSALLSGTPGNAEVGNHNVVIEVSDGVLSTSQSFTINVVNVNDAPQITSSANTSATQDSAYSYTLNSSDVDGDALSINAITLPAWLSLIDNGDGTALLSGTPGNAEVGNHNVVIEVSDGVLSSSQSFTINVANVNDAPQITSSATINAAENQTTVTTVTATDVDGDQLSYSITGGADSALFSITSGGILSFNSAPDFENPTDANSDGVYQVQVTADDGQGGSVAQLISVSVTNVNEAPSATPVNLTAINEDSSPLRITQEQLLSNASDGDLDVLTATGLTISSGAGSLNDNGDGSWTYTPSVNDDTSVSFAYNITDGLAITSNSATLDILPVNDAPVTVASSFTTDEDVPLQSLDILSNVSDIDSNTLSISTVSALHGSVSINPDNAINYIPDADYNGDDLISYSVDDGNGGQSSGIASVTVNPVSDVKNDTLATQVDKSAILNVLVNDNSGSISRIDSITQPMHGQVVFSDNGFVTYTPSQGYIGSDTFSYSVQTAAGEIETGIVTVEVQQPVSILDLNIVQQPLVDQINVKSDTTLTQPENQIAVASPTNTGEEQPVSSTKSSASEDIPDSSLSNVETKLEALINVTGEKNVVFNVENPPAIQDSVKIRHVTNSRQQQVQSTKSAMDLKQMQMQALNDQLSNQVNLSQWDDGNGDIDAEEEKLLGRIDEMKHSIDQDMEAEQQNQVDVQIVLGSTAGVTAGIVGWVLRGGSLLASMMTTLPLVNKFDPLPVINAKEQRKADARDDEKTEKEDEGRIAKMFIKGANSDV